MDLYGIGPIPTTFVIDEEGRIIDEIAGVFDKDKLEYTSIGDRK